MLKVHKERQGFIYSIVIIFNFNHFYFKERARPLGYEVDL